MKIVLEKVKIKYFDPKKANKRVYNGSEMVNYDVMLFISEEQKRLIDEYIYGKCELTKDDEILFYGRSKNPIPFFDQNRQKVENAITKPFFADASILIDEFADKNTGLPVRYSKCLGVKFLEFTGEASTFRESETYETFDEIFGDAENKGVGSFEALAKKDNQLPVDCSSDSSAPTYNPIPPIENDLPF
jgi:hypothetical protein